MITRCLVNIADDRVQKKPAPLLDGCNFFTGELPLARLRSTGTFVMNICDQQDWQKAWEQIGVDAPGDLPKGASASIVIFNAQGKRPVMFPPAARERDDATQIDWNIAEEAMEPTVKNGCYGVLLFGGRSDKTEQDFRHTVLSPPPFDARTAICSDAPVQASEKITVHRHKRPPVP